MVVIHHYFDCVTQGRITDMAIVRKLGIHEVPHILKQCGRMADQG